MAHAPNLLASWAKKLCPDCHKPLGALYAGLVRHPICEARRTPCDICNQPLGDEHDSPAHKQCIEEEMQRVNEQLLP